YGCLIASLMVLRARRDEELLQKNAMLRALPDMMFLLSCDGVYLDYHARDPSDLLVPPSSFLGRNMREILPPDLAGGGGGGGGRRGARTAPRAVVGSPVL